MYGIYSEFTVNCEVLASTKPFESHFFAPLNVVAADILLWRNTKISSSVLTGATTAWVLFEWLNYHFLTLVCFALVLGMIAQFLWSNASGLFNRL